MKKCILCTTYLPSLQPHHSVWPVAKGFKPFTCGLFNSHDSLGIHYKYAKRVACNNWFRCLTLSSVKSPIPCVGTTCSSGYKHRLLYYMYIVGSFRITHFKSCMAFPPTCLNMGVVYTNATFQSFDFFAFLLIEPVRPTIL